MKQQNPIVKLSHPGQEPPEIILNLGHIRKAQSSLESILHPFRFRLLETIDHLNQNATLEALIISMDSDKKLVQLNLKALAKHKIIYTDRNAYNKLIYCRNEEKYAKVLQLVNELN